MTATRKVDWISPGAYLAMEERSQVRHEYVDGQIYAMSGASRAHNLITLNLVRATARSVRFRKPCQVYASDVKVHIATRNIYYYPDLVVSCRPEAATHWVDQPCLVIEVLSPGTATTDLREKRHNYSALPSLQSYVMVEQDRPGIVVLRRDGSGWTEETLDAGGLLTLDCLDLTLPVDEVYEGLDGPG